MLCWNELCAIRRSFCLNFEKIRRRGKSPLVPNPPSVLVYSVRASTWSVFRWPLILHMEANFPRRAALSDSPLRSLQQPFPSHNPNRLKHDIAPSPSVCDPVWCHCVALRVYSKIKGCFGVQMGPAASPNPNLPPPLPLPIPMRLRDRRGFFKPGLPSRFFVCNSISLTLRPPKKTAIKNNP